MSLFLNDTWSFGRLTFNGGVRWDRYHGWLPEQNQLAATVGPISVPAKTFAEQDLFTWNVVAPRIGVVFDLTGDGRTVVKGNYGLYWHNPGVGVPGDVNPNTGTKSATYFWADRNGDRRMAAWRRDHAAVGARSKARCSSTRTSRRRIRTKRRPGSSGS